MMRRSTTSPPASRREPECHAAIEGREEESAIRQARHFLAKLPAMMIRERDAHIAATISTYSALREPNA